MAGFEGENTGSNPEAELLEAPPSSTPVTRDGSGIETSLGGGVAVADGRCYFGTATGDVVCETPGGRRWAYEADTAAGVRSIPSLARDVVYRRSRASAPRLDLGVKPVETVTKPQDLIRDNDQNTTLKIGR
ncbi:PQQ-binding-like beta-propeller repeat protein [Natronococcus occultus]|uniref:hypothetical protein n=1 Tax=Natronococcus occultus TaxID=29288 RepID=UPI0006780FC5|nr:hypothetical protein [Natronococcus occultus]